MSERSALTVEIHGPDAMRRAGGLLAGALPPRGAPAVVVALDGDLGSGKSTLTSGFLTALGIAGPHRSPTYTLVEPYEIDGRPVSHLDLYRVADPAELETLGLRDLAVPGAVIVVEWASRGGRELPRYDLHLQLAYALDAQSRVLTGHAASPCGERLLAALRSSHDPELIHLS